MIEVTSDEYFATVVHIYVCVSYFPVLNEIPSQFFSSSLSLIYFYWNCPFQYSNIYLQLAHSRKFYLKHKSAAGRNGFLSAVSLIWRNC